MAHFSSRQLESDANFRLQQHLQLLDEELALAERLRLNPPRARRALNFVPSNIITSLWRRFYSYGRLKAAPKGAFAVGSEPAQAHKEG